MVSGKYRSIVSLVRKRLLEAKSEKEFKLLANVLNRVACMEKAEAGDTDALIKLSEEVLRYEK
jgi:hypothetical protein